MLSLMDVFDIYVALWEGARVAGACVHYFDHPRADPPSLLGDRTGASGWFLANADVEDGQPVIQIYRLECDDDSFTPSRTRGPGGANLPPPDLEHELITLAHEYGHLMSYLGRTPREDWEKYDAAARRRGEIVDHVIDLMAADLPPVAVSDRIRHALYDGLNEEDRVRIVAEEALAWRIGQEVLRELGLDDFEQFNKREVEGLHAHRYRLGLDDPWPGDEVGITSE